MIHRGTTWFTGPLEVCTPPLRRGSRGPEIATLQGQLHRLGFEPGPIDGYFGPKTRKGVVAFQGENRLVRDGIVGRLTSEVLYRKLRAFLREGHSLGRAGAVVDEAGNALPIDRSLRLNQDGYYRVAHNKDLIVLHHTSGGSVRSTINWWNQSPRRTAAAYVVARDGTIHELFDPKYWACHLGLTGTRGSVDRRSIGIEIACEGGLTEAGGSLYRFDRVLPSHQYTAPPYTHEEKWRGYRHYAPYTPEQMSAVITLTDHLFDRFNIPRRTPEKHIDYDWKNIEFRGIIGHHQIRRDKSDLHPGFGWGELVEGCRLRRG